MIANTHSIMLYVSAEESFMTNTALAPALNTITVDKLLHHIKMLASDEFEGRAPGSIGEELTVEYITSICKELELEPAGDQGTYLQAMPVTGIQAQGRANFSSGSSKLDLKRPDEIIMWSQTRQEHVSVESDVVFVGYGIVAPEYGWDDYKGLDVRGKTVVMLVGDPSRPHPEDAARLDEEFFKGRALTYYGRWDYKFEIASKKGAAAVLIVHNRQRAGYGYEVVVDSFIGERFFLARDPNRVQCEGWLSGEGARKLCALAGSSFDDLEKTAEKPDFKPVDLRVRASIFIENSMRTFVSRNIIARITGDDSSLQHECVVYSAHWDHFGKVEKDGETRILSGALDNGSGVAVVLEIARAFANLDRRARRSIIFLFTTLEEHGLLGAQYYVQQPTVPLSDTIAVINFDIMSPWGRTHKIISVARGHSTLDEVLEEQAAAQNRTVGDDLEPEKGYFFRSDHLEFLRKGVPALFFLNPGDDYIDQPSDFGDMKRKDYLTNGYHKVGDKVKPDWDLSGMVEDAQLLCMTGLKVADNAVRPVWKDGSEFKNAGTK
jgi:Zn-dependent M28 family amino/carboxypeptidase